MLRSVLTATGLALLLGAAGCGSSTPATPANLSAPSVAAAPAVTGSPTPERLETSYLDATAAHLCAVQSQVYTDPAAMAAAFASKPTYATLTDAQVEQYQQRVIADPAFAARLTAKIQETCGAVK